MSAALPQATRERSFELTTPEQVPIRFTLGDLGSRFGALVLDLFFQLVIILVLASLGGLLLGSTLRDGHLGAVSMLAVFAVRNFYFTASEVFGKGQTPGKRLAKLRVVARDGGPLTTDQIFARNLTRDFEIFLPLTALMAPGNLLPNSPWWGDLATGVWIMILGLLPFFNRQRARLGDLVAGTLVVAEPQAQLQEDLADLRGELATERFTDYTFTRDQLDVYGIRELQVLEDLLRRPPSAERDRTFERVCEKILAKIDWDIAAQPVEPRAFLTAFYAAQRGRLEHKALLGERRERKVR